MKDREVRDEIPAWVGGTGQYAVIHVQYEPGGGEAWPVVQRVPGGWQSGAHHYPDDAVLNVRPLMLIDPEDVRPVVQRTGPNPLEDSTQWATNRDMAEEFERGRAVGARATRVSDVQRVTDHLLTHAVDTAARAVVDAAVAWHRSGKASDQVVLRRAIKTYLTE